MTSWRDSTPDHVQTDFDGLFGLCLDAALDLLTKHQEFYPFGFHAHDGEAVMVGSEPGLGDHPESQAVLDLLVEGARRRSGDIDAVAHVYDVRLESGSDAVCVDLEHREGHALQIVTPYRIEAVGRGVETGQMSVSTGVRRVWT